VGTAGEMTVEIAAKIGATAGIRDDKQEGTDVSSPPLHDANGVNFDSSKACPHQMSKLN
jgi:hypothetical protein